jgi:DNA-binding GntR family transcriptional regulator
VKLLKIELFSPKSLKSQAYEILKMAIISGVLKDNELISERIAMEKFQISRTPFREVIPTLEAEGWVKSIPYKGVFVKPLTLKDIEEVFELRMIVEPAIARHVQGKIEADSLQKMEKILNFMKADTNKQDDYEFMTLDRDFHKAIYELTDNKRLINSAELISDVMHRIGMRSLTRDKRRQDAIAEHKEILEAFKKGNAEEAVMKHLENTMGVFCEGFEE